VPQVVIVGASGHGREVFDTARAAAAATHLRGLDVRGFVDDGEVDLDRLERIGARLLGDTGWLAAHPGSYVLGIGTSGVRRRLADRLEAAGCSPFTLVHPSSHIGVDVELGDGVVVFDRCTVTTNVRIGRHTHLNVGCAVQHDSRVGDFVQFSPGVFVNGDCVVEDGVFLGTGAIVTRGCRVGAAARVGAGAVVLDDVAPGTTVLGAPARPRT
jgi:sugar O-acyltransferase (sialic acid O-acetyltransferase NeuD family)